MSAPDKNKPAAAAAAAAAADKNADKNAKPLAGAGAAPPAAVATAAAHNPAQAALAKEAAAAANASHKPIDLNSKIQRTPIMADLYHGAVPMPHHRCTDPCPDEQFEAELARRARIEQDHDMEEERRAENASGMGPLGGFFTKAGHIKDNADRDARNISERNLARDEHRQMTDKFAQDFPELTGEGDTAMATFCASVISKGHVVSGCLFVTRDHVAFISQAVKDAIPLRGIVSIQRSLALNTEEGHPHVMPVPAPHAVPDSVQVFVRDGRLVQFLNIREATYEPAHAHAVTIAGSPADHFFNWLDHAWRAAVHVPVQGVQYAGDASSQQFTAQHAPKLLGAAGAANAGDSGKPAALGTAKPNMDAARPAMGAAKPATDMKPVLGAAKPLDAPKAGVALPHDAKDAHDKTPAMQR